MNIQSFTITNAKLGLQQKEFSSVELTKACLEQIRLHDKKLNAFITVTEKEALAQAKLADSLRATGTELPLLGIPVALKDLFLTKDIRVTAGAQVLSEYIGQYDGTV